MATIEMPDSTEVAKKSKDVVTIALSMKIQTHDDNQKASEILLHVMSLKKQVIVTFEKQKSLAAQTHRAICAAERSHLDPLERAEMILKRGIGDWRLNEQRRIDGENARLRKIAQDEADAKKRDQDRQQEEDRLRMAQELASRGDTKGADEILEAPVYTAPVIPQVAAVLQIQKTKGVSDRRKLSFRIVDEKIAHRLILSFVPEEKKREVEKILGVMSMDPTKIRKEIAYLGNESVIPGVEIFEEMQISGRAG